MVVCVFTVLANTAVCEDFDSNEPNRPGSRLSDPNSNERFDQDDADVQTPAAENEIVDIIARLGDPDYFVRQDAETQLLKIGGPAIEPLTRLLINRGIGLPDTEVQLRASRLLIRIQRSEQSRKIHEFLRGNTEQSGLAGWTQFSEIAGSDATARKLFVNMHDSEPEFLSTINGGLELTTASFQRTVKGSLQMGSRRNMMKSLGTLTSVLFLASITIDGESEQTVGRVRYSDGDLRKIGNVLNHPQMIAFVKRSGSNVQMERIISGWLDTLATDEMPAIAVKLSAITGYQLTNQVDWLLSILNHPSLPNQTRVAAIEAISQLGDEKLAPKIEALFNDNSVIGSYVARHENKTLKPNRSRPVPGKPQLMHVQFRDLALITAIRLLRKDPSDFGFSPEAMPNHRLVINQAGFLTDQERNIAFRKWHQLAAEVDSK